MKTEVFNIPIEPLEERYSTQWANWFQKSFTAAGVPYKPITGTTAYTSGTIKYGSFLDVIDTHHWKTRQQEKIVNLLSVYDNKEKWVFFFHDLWHPALTVLAYIRDGMGWDNIKICGCLHAGSYDEHDFLNKRGMTPWAKHVEKGWFAHLVDEIYVATEFHKQLLVLERDVAPSKIKKTGFPIFPSDFPGYFDAREKEKIVVFPHRLDDEKNPQFFDALKKAVNRRSWKFVKSKDVCKTKADYYALLAKAQIAVSFNDQETWGIAMQEAVFMGCVPIVPDRLSYSEMYDHLFVFNSFDEAVNLVKCYMDNFADIQPTLERNAEKFQRQGNAAIYKMIEYINRL